MKLTSVERVERSQLIPGVRQTRWRRIAEVRRPAAFWSAVLGIGGMCACGEPRTLRVPGGDMEPNIKIGETIRLDPARYASVGDVKHGDVIVFGMPGDATRVFVKRVAAVPGERVSVRAGRVRLNGADLELLAAEEQPIEVARNARYRVQISDSCGEESREVVVPDGHLFVLGDNRCASLDSRAFGTVPFSSVLGRVISE
jgi:signal peptidase I